MTTSRKSSFVLCLRNGDSEDLEPRKIYEVLRDLAAAREGYARVIDESGEDYLYPAAYFIPVRLPILIAQQLASEHKRPKAGRPARPRLKAHVSG